MATTTTDRSEREFKFTERDFRYISQLIREHAGIVLSEGKQELVYGRLARRLRVLGLKTFSSYCELLRQGGEEEFIHCVNAITTNLTRFFREIHHFEVLREKLLPEALQRRRASRRIRIWSAGCSTGEEPYSIAVVVNEVVPRNQGWDVKILATDLDTNVLDKASSGLYDLEKLEGLPRQTVKKWFTPTPDKKQVVVAPALRELITFKQLNLMQGWPMRGPFDVIFCRNVIIYFDAETKVNLVKPYGSLLEPGSHLILGHSEAVFRGSHDFDLVGQTIYRKRAGA